jgi:hypothetical protein
MRTSVPDDPAIHPDEIPYHPDLLCPVLRAVAVMYGGDVSLRHQTLGGNPDGMTLLVTPDLDIVLLWDRDAQQYVPAYNRRSPGVCGTVTTRETLDRATADRNPRLMCILIRALAARHSRLPGGDHAHPHR